MLAATKIKMKFIYFSIFILLVCSCYTDTINDNNRDSKIALIHNFTLSGNMNQTDTAYYEKQIYSDTILYYYWVDNNKDSLWQYYSAMKIKDNDSILYFNGLQCPLEDTKSYNLKNTNYKIGKFYFDEEKGVDEECVVYFNDSLGILLIYSYGWLYMQAIINYNDKTEYLINKIINDSTNDFPLFERKNLNDILPPTQS